MEILTHKNWIDPTHCFCNFPIEELKEWASKRYYEHHSTVELLSSTEDPNEREMICAVTLLDVDEQTVLRMMGDVDQPGQHILHCIEQLRKIVDEECLR